MENVLKYYEFSLFIKDESTAFHGNQIAFTELNATHFLIFEKKEDAYNLYVSRYSHKNEIGVKPPTEDETGSHFVVQLPLNEAIDFEKNLCLNQRINS